MQLLVVDNGNVLVVVGVVCELLSAVSIVGAALVGPNLGFESQATGAG